MRYQRILPLAISKRYQCVVLGASSHILTVGVIERENEALLHFLHMLTGATIFPVLIEQKRMQLLIARIERHQRLYQQERWAYYGRHYVAQVRLLLAFYER